MTSSRDLRLPDRSRLHTLLDRSSIRRAIPLLAAASVFLAYLPLATFRYAFLDDYANMMDHGFRGVNPFLIDDGRVLGGAISIFLFTVFDYVSAAPVLRLMGLAYLVTSVVFIQRALRLAGLERGWAAFAAVLFAASPTVQNWVVWGVSAWQLPALVLGLAAFFPWRRVVDSAGRASPVHIALFVGAQVAAMLIYQPFALAAWPLIFVDVVLNGDRPFMRRRLILSLFALALVLALTFLIAKTLIWLFVIDNHRNRTALIALPNLPARLWWFFTTQVTFVLSYVCEAPLAIVYGPAIAVIVCGLALRTRSASLWFGATILLGGTCLIAGLPALIAAEYTSIRTDVALAVLACGVLAVAIRQICRRLDPRLSLVPAVLALAALAYSSFNVITVNALPQKRELDMIDAYLSRHPLPENRPIVLVGLPIGSSFVNRSCGIVMIGCANSAVRYALPNIVRLWLRDHGLNLRPNALFFAQSQRDEQVFSFETARSTMVPMPKNPFFLDIAMAFRAI